MAPKQHMKIANEKAQKNILLRGNVPKSTVSVHGIWCPKDPSLIWPWPWPAASCTIRVIIKNIRHVDNVLMTWKLGCPLLCTTTIANTVYIHLISNWLSPSPPLAEEQGGPVARWPVAVDPLRLCGLRLGHLPDHPVHSRRVGPPLLCKYI